jgi:hypothetical protein
MSRRKLADRRTLPSIVKVGVYEYGDKIDKLFSHAKLVRPSDGVHQEHTDWVLGKLVPNLCLTVSTIPPNWKIPQEHVP